MQDLHPLREWFCKLCREKPYFHSHPRTGARCLWCPCGHYASCLCNVCINARELETRFPSVDIV